MKRILTAIAFLSVLCGCADYDINEVLLSKTEISLSLKGKVIYTMDPNMGQYAYRPEINEYRVTDDDLGSWFIFRSDIRPNTEKATVKADMQWATKTSIDNVKDAAFTVEKVGDDGLVWLWCESEKIGVVIKDI